MEFITKPQIRTILCSNFQNILGIAQKDENQRQGQCQLHDKYQVLEGFSVWYGNPDKGKS